MLDLHSFFKNHFNTTEISDDHLREFIEDHIGRITANNGGGLFTTMLSDTNTAYTDYFGAISDEDLAAAVQQSLTMSTDNLITSFQKAIQDDEGTIRGMFGQGSPTYQEFFPHGKTEYSNANKSNVEVLMNRMKSSTAAHAADFTAPFVAKYNAFPANYSTARNLQVTKIGEVTARKDTTATSRDGIETQLMKNLFFVGFNFPGDVAACVAFFDQSIIRRKQSADSDGKGRVSGSIFDAVTSLPLAFVTVHVMDGGISDTKSDADGHYITDNLAVGTVTVVFSLSGYKEQTISLKVLDVGNTPLDVKMVPI